MSGVFAQSLLITLTDNMSTPTVPLVGSFMMGRDNLGGDNWDRATLATLFDGDTGVGTQSILGTILRGSASGGSYELPSTLSDGLLVNLGSNNDVTVTGTVTANAGTNLNTSLLSLETTQVLAKDALERIDDWDESDRCKVNLIVGQAGVQGGSGVVTALTQRMVLATDVGLPAGTSNIGDVDVLTMNHGKTLKTLSGVTDGASGNKTLVSAVASNKIKVFAFSLSMESATSQTCIFQSGAGGTELWRLILRAPNNTTTGANLATSVPGHLFETAVNTLLNLNLSAAVAVHWSVAYFEEA